RVGPVRAVEADHGVEVDQAPTLVLGDLRVREPGGLSELRTRQADPPGDLPPQLQPEPVPEPTGERVPEDCPGVVVAARAERFTETAIVRRVALPAPGRSPVRAVVTCPARPAGSHVPVTFAACMDRAEPGGGERGEHPW